MIRGMHAMFYSSAAEEFRNFLRDKLGFTFTDVGDGWLIFDMPEADLGCHPAGPEQGATSGTPNVSFYCDDIEKTVAEMQSRGVEFTGPVEDHGYGLVSFFRMPGDFSVQLYQPKYVKNARPKAAVEAKVRKLSPKKAARAKKKTPERRVMKRKRLALGQKSRASARTKSKRRRSR